MIKKDDHTTPPCHHQNTNTNTKRQQQSKMTMMESSKYTTTNNILAKKLRLAAEKVLIDPWSKFRIDEIPAERVILHTYHRESKTWHCEESMVKIESKPFTCGAMRHCFRMKMLTQLQSQSQSQSASELQSQSQQPRNGISISNGNNNNSSKNHRYNGWKRALNYVAKGYLKPNMTYDCENNENNKSNSNNSNSNNSNSNNSNSNNSNSENNNSENNNNNETTINLEHMMDTSETAKEAVYNDILVLQEASKWALRFNRRDPPKEILFLQAFAVEFPDRPDSPLFATERYISGKDSHGMGFHKHNTNSGFVDELQGRNTPQIFSAHSFYSSRGKRLVADIQGVGDLYTDPQVLSCDYRFGDGDLGPRGMALFFHSFRHSKFADSMGLPLFPLSKHEREEQMKLDHNEENEHDNKYCQQEMHDQEDENMLYLHLDDHRRSRTLLGSFQLENSLLLSHKQNLFRTINTNTCGNHEHTNNNKNKNSSSSSSYLNILRSNISKSISKSISILSLRNSIDVMTHNNSKSPPSSSSSSSTHKSKRYCDTTQEIEDCLQIALKEPHFEYNATQQNLSTLQYTPHNPNATTKSNHLRATTMLRTLQPIIPDDVTKFNLGNIHYHLACLHGTGRFQSQKDNKVDDNGQHHHQQQHDHDAFSALFHLCHAVSLHNLSACLALARVCCGLESTVSNLLHTIVPVDFDNAKLLLIRTMETPIILTTKRVKESSYATIKAAAGCLLCQILEDERNLILLQQDQGNTTTATTTKPSHNNTLVEFEDQKMMQVLSDTLAFLAKSSSDDAMDALQDMDDLKITSTPQEEVCLNIGDKVEANYCLEGTFYDATVVEINEEEVTVRYDDDNTHERLPRDQVKKFSSSMDHDEDIEEVPKGEIHPMSDREALGLGENLDEECLFQEYELKAKLAEFKRKKGDFQGASTLYAEAAEGAMDDGKMQKASEWSSYVL